MPPIPTTEQAIVVLTNLPDALSAQKLARQLVEQNLAACVNILDGIESIYRWQGAVEMANECCLLIKSTQARYTELEAAIKSAHPYQVPEIIALPIVAAWPPCLEWIATETKKDQDV